MKLAGGGGCCAGQSQHGRQLLIKISEKSNVYIFSKRNMLIFV